MQLSYKSNKSVSSLQKVIIAVLRHKVHVIKYFTLQLGCFDANGLFVCCRCTSCVTSEWGCSWCAGSGTCNNSSTCANQLVTNSSTCPVVIGYNLNTSTFIPVGKPMTFYLGTLFLPGVST